jgi:hypothetical protein
MTAAATPDRLYELLPVVYRQRDEEAGHPLRDLLRVIAEQVQLVEDDITQLYDDWFIETCQEWVVPYLADLLGYRPSTTMPDPGGMSESALLRRRVLAPRREVATLVAAHRRRGTLPLLELLAADAAGLPARAIELYPQLLRTQAIDHLYTDRGRTADLRNGDALDRLGGAFDEGSRFADVRGINSAVARGLYNIPNAATYVWRLRSHSVTNAPAYFLQKAGAGYLRYTFSLLGNDAPLFTNARRVDDASAIATEADVPAPIRRRALDLQHDAFYPASFAIWKDDRTRPIAAESIISTDLTGWTYRPPKGKVAVDPKLGRFVFPIGEGPKEGVWVSYHYGFSGDIGGGEYPRRLSQHRDAIVYRVGENEQFKTINAAVHQWRADARRSAVIEIADSGMYIEEVAVDLGPKQYLQIRAAAHCRPLLNLYDAKASLGEWFRVTMGTGARLTLDGLTVSGRPLRVETAQGQPSEARITIRHCTFVPGWTLDEHCQAESPTEASIETYDVRGTLRIEHSIAGSIMIANKTLDGEPLQVSISDSIVDATGHGLPAISGPDQDAAWATLTIARCTVIGALRAHAIELAENSIFTAAVRVVRRHPGCMRFCYVPREESRTPRRYLCEPDRAREVARREAAQGEDPDKLANAAEARVVPHFNSLRYGTPDYCQLALDCAEEIARGADDGSEMGAFHDLYLPLRAANLRVRLDEHTPAGMDTGIIYAD